jgi:transposase InsO family protein
MIFDNDSIFSDEDSKSIKTLGITPKRTAFRSPWQNGTAERWVSTCKRELIDHVIVLGEDHIRRLLRDYVAYYNADTNDKKQRNRPPAQ